MHLAGRMRWLNPGERARDTPSSAIPEVLPDARIYQAGTERCSCSNASKGPPTAAAALILGVVLAPAQTLAQQTVIVIPPPPGLPSILP